MKSGQLYTNSLCSSWAIGLTRCIGELTGKYHVCIGRLCYLQFWYKCSCCWNTVFVLMSTDKDIDRLGGAKRGQREAERAIKGLKTVPSKGKVTE